MFPVPHYPVKDNQLYGTVRAKSPVAADGIKKEKDRFPKLTYPPTEDLESRYSIALTSYPRPYIRYEYWQYSYLI
jgi:hypothetical protein